MNCSVLKTILQLLMLLCIGGESESEAIHVPPTLLVFFDSYSQPTGTPGNSLKCTHRKGILDVFKDFPFIERCFIFMQHCRSVFRAR